MLVKDFIKGPLLSEIEAMTMCGDMASHPYLGFQLICPAIEFLGACLDQYPWEEKGMSEKRFRLALKELFNQKYSECNEGDEFDLYSNLRCSLVHSSRPGNAIGLSELKSKTIHLSRFSGQGGKKQMVLIYEEFLIDFKNACKSLLVLIDDRKINNHKVYSHILSVI